MKPNQENEAKKSYHRPQVLDYGNIKEITLKNTGTKADSGASKT